MNIHVDHSIEAGLGKFETKSLSLWLKQSFRKLMGKPLLQNKVLEKVVNQLKADENLLSIFLFGSVAVGTHTWKSDIDLIFVYETYEPSSGLSNRFVDGIVVQYFFTTLDTLIQNTDSVPYLLHMFSEDGNVPFLYFHDSRFCQNKPLEPECSESVRRINHAN